jgi:large subunit ribosomal protein L4
MAIASKIQDDQLIVIDDLAFDAPKTADMAAILRHLDCDNGSLLVTTAEHSVNVYKSARNIPRVSIATAGELNALTVLSSRRMLATKKALDLIKERAAADNKKEVKES